MRLRRHWLTLAAVALGLALFAGDGSTLLAAALQEQPPARRGPGDRLQGQRPGGPRRGPGPPDRLLRELLVRVAPLPPNEQQQLLDRDEGFQRLPPMAQERFRRRLQQFNALPPEERQRMLERWNRGGQMQDAQALFLRLAPLPAAEQQAALEADELFRQMPPPMQERFRRHLEEFNTRPPEERQRLLERFQRFAELPREGQERIRRRAQLFAAMSPEERQQAQRVFQAWQQLPPERRSLLAERLRRLRQASPDEQATLLEDPDFIAPLDQSERDLLHQLWRLRQSLPESPVTPPR